MLRIHPQRLLCIFVALTTGCAAIESSEHGAVKSMSVCQLYATRWSPPAGEIRIKATAYMGPRHGAILVDPHCPPGATIEFRFADHLSHNSAAAKFDHALTGNVMDLSLRVFDIQAIGRFSAASESTPRGLFYIEQIDWFKKQQQPQ